MNLESMHEVEQKFTAALKRNPAWSHPYYRSAQKAFLVSEMPGQEDDRGCYGSTIVYTHGINAIRKAGITFTEKRSECLFDHAHKVAELSKQHFAYVELASMSPRTLEYFLAEYPTGWFATRVEHQLGHLMGVRTVGNNLAAPYAVWDTATESEHTHVRRNFFGFDDLTMLHSRINAHHCLRVEIPILFMGFAKKTRRDDPTYDDPVDLSTELALPAFIVRQ